MLKKIAPIRSHVIALSFGDAAIFIIFCSTRSDNAFYSCLAPSSFLYPPCCSWSKKQVLPPLSNLGSGLLFDLKACPAYEMVELDVPSTIFPEALGEKASSLIPWENADMIMFL